MMYFDTWWEIKLLISMFIWFFALILPVLLILSRRYIDYMFCMVFIFFLFVISYYHPNDLRIFLVVLIFWKVLFLSIKLVIGDIFAQKYKKNELLISFAIILSVLFIQYLSFSNNSLAQILYIPFWNIVIDFATTIVILVYVFIKDMRKSKLKPDNISL